MHASLVLVNQLPGVGTAAVVTRRKGSAGFDDMILLAADHAGVTEYRLGLRALTQLRRRAASPSGGLDSVVVAYESLSAQEPFLVGRQMLRELDSLQSRARETIPHVGLGRRIDITVAK